MTSGTSAGRCPSASSGRWSSRVTSGGSRRRSARTPASRSTARRRSSGSRCGPGRKRRRRGGWRRSAHAWTKNVPHASASDSRMRKICIVVGSRANYSSIKSVMCAVRAHPDLELQLIVGASALLDRFGSVVDVIEADGFEPDAKVTMIVEGETPGTMAKSTGLGLIELPTIFGMLKPDVVVSVGDRFETMATAVAAAYMNIPLAHTMGGEISGTIDESIRHAVTKLSHLHFPANKQAADRIVRMGEDPAAVHVVGCPRIDLVSEISRGNGHLESPDWLEREGVGAHITLDKPFLLVSQHPVPNRYGQGSGHMLE